VLVGEIQGQLVAVAGLDLDGAAIRGLCVVPQWRRRGVGRRMLEALEQRAVQFGLIRLNVYVPGFSEVFFRSAGYRPSRDAAWVPDPRSQVGCLPMRRAFPKRQTRYGARIRRILSRTGIPLDYGRIHRLPLQPECRELASIGLDIHQREQMLLPEAASAWHALRLAAQRENVVLQVVSAYRSVAYQSGIIDRKLGAGQTIDEILQVSAAPGYSEHHTGRALDITTPGSPPLETRFESTPAFEWLTESGQTFGFRLSYPRHNRHQIAYEPWHWAWQPG